MDSGIFVQVLSSAEVIAASLVVILLLPLVFFIASTRSRRRSVRKPARGRIPASLRPSAEARSRPRGRAAEPEDSE
ncbi:MAG: hypothetical protein ACLQDL_03285 [Spirochaetia bacterium]